MCNRWLPHHIRGSLMFACCVGDRGRQAVSPGTGLAKVRLPLPPGTAADLRHDRGGLCHGRDGGPPAGFSRRCGG